MHTLLHWATEAQKEKYLRPLCDGVARSCFAMTEPEVAGSDPTLTPFLMTQDAFLQYFMASYPARMEFPAESAGPSGGFVVAWLCTG